MTAEALKPCPFCGSPDVAVSGDWCVGFYVECRGCTALLGMTNADDYYAVYGEFETEKAAIEAWNKRA